LGTLGCAWTDCVPVELIQGGLSDGDLRALAELEAGVVAADGGRLKLEWPWLRTRTPGQVNDFLWREGGEVLGFAGLYGMTHSDTVEIAGMVDPGARRRGVGTALLEAAVQTAAERSFAEALLIVPRNDWGGLEFALAAGGTLDHSEHALLLKQRPAGSAGGKNVAFRRATTDDIPELARLLTAGFGDAPSDIERILSHEASRTLMIEQDDQVVGTVRVIDDSGIYGFVIDRAHQGQGLGREALRLTCEDLFERGAESVHLEVEVTNDRALGLYTSLGFALVSTEDYYTLEVGSRAG
jgi:ribosomal protein S18 acetylase RimI-like enzyme